MASSQNIPQSFYEICYFDFETNLSIPSEFAEKYETLTFVKLKSLSKGSWNVKIEKIGDRLFITDGWSEFVTDNKLVKLNLLIFRIAGESTLDVSIFDNNYCLKEPTISATSSPLSASSVSAKTWRFVKELKGHNFSVKRMDIPKSFAKRTGIETKSKIELENGEGWRWEVSLTSRISDVFFSMTRGLMKFLESNKFEAGHILLFEFVPNSENVVKVVKMDNEGGRELLARARKGGMLY